MGFKWSKYRPGGSKGIPLAPTPIASMLFKEGGKLFNSVNSSKYGLPNVLKSTKTAFDNPKESLKYLWDDAMSPGFDDAGGIGPSFAAGQALAEGQAAADRNAQDFGSMSNQDLYRFQTETAPDRRSPFDNQSRANFDNTYNAASRPRVYSTDNSFVYPNTEPVRQNTALIPSTAQPMVIGGVSPMSGAPQFSPEVTAQTARPGYLGAAPDADSVAAQFRIPAQPRKRSATVVR